MSMFSIGDKRWPGLSKLVEEAGEVVQIVGKLMGTRGAHKHWDGSNLKERLELELGDLLAAITFVKYMCRLDIGKIQKHDEKVALFHQWHENGDQV